MEEEISNPWRTELSFFLRRAPRTFVVLSETLNNIKEKLLFPPLQEPSVEKYVNEDSPNIKDFNTNFASLQSWFIHSSHQTKVQFILKLVRLFLKEHNADLLLEFIELSGTSKDLLYGRSQYTHTVQDKTPLDDNRSTTLGAMLFEAQSISFVWFSSLAEREQALVIITLSSMGGASLSYTIVRETLKIVQDKRRQSKGKARHCLFDADSDFYHHLEAGRLKSFLKGHRKSVKAETGSMYKGLNPDSVLAKKEAEWQEMYSYLLEQSGLITKRHTKQINKEEPIDSLQLMPISVNRVIYSYLDSKSKFNLRCVNKYWKIMGQEIQKEENIRQWLNKIIRKMQIKGTAFKGRSWGSFNNKTDNRKLNDSVSFDNVSRLRTDMSEVRTFSGMSNNFSASRTEDADIPQKIKRTQSEPNLKITKFEMKTRSDFEVTLQQKPSMKFPYVGKYTVIKISERYDHERVMAANKQWIAISDGCNITLHSFLTGAPLIARLEGHTACVTALAFHPSRSRIFSGSYDTTIRYWDIYSRTLIHEFCGHQSVITSISANEVFLCSASMDQTIKVFDITSGVITWSYECVTAPTVVAIDKRQTLYAGSFTGHVEKIFLSYDEDFKKSDVCPSEELPPVTTVDGLGLNFELPKDDIGSVKSEKSIRTATSRFDMSSSSGRMDDGEEGAEEGVGEEMSQGSQISSNRIRFAHSGEVTSIFVEPPLILTSGVDGVVHVWHSEYFDDGLLMTLHHNGRRVNSVAVSYLLILTASEDGRLRIWDIETKSLKREIVVNTNRRPIISMVCLEMFDHSKVVLNNEDGIKVLEFPFDWINLRKLCMDKKNIRTPPKQLIRNLTASPSDLFSESQFKKLPVKNTYSEKRARDLEVRWSTLREIQAIGPKHMFAKGMPPVLQATPAPERMLQFDRYLGPPVQELDNLKVKVDENPESKQCLFRSRHKQMITSKKGILFNFNSTKKVL